MKSSNGLGPLLRMIRVDYCPKSLTQHQMSQRLGYSESLETYGHYERGARKPPKDTLIEIFLILIESGGVAAYMADREPGELSASAAIVAVVNHAMQVCDYAPISEKDSEVYSRLVSAWSNSRIKQKAPVPLDNTSSSLDARIAWELYVELSTRVATAEVNEGEGLIREALESLYALFQATRTILRNYGPEAGNTKAGAIALDLLNDVLRPFLSKWHPMLKEHEQQSSHHASGFTYEQSWVYLSDFYTAMRQLRVLISTYRDQLAKIAQLSLRQTRSGI